MSKRELAAIHGRSFACWSFRVSVASQFWGRLRDQAFQLLNCFSYTSEMSGTGDERYV